MIPLEAVAIEAQLMTIIFAMVRPGAALLIGPIFGGARVPVQLRVLLSVMIAWTTIANIGLILPENGLLSFNGISAIVLEALIGLALGFSLQIGLSSAQMAGEIISNAMGLGFAAMNDPMSGQMSAAVGQFMLMLATMLFLSFDGHTHLIRLIVESYRTIPPGNTGLARETFKVMAGMGSLLFSGALIVALPVAFGTVLVHIAMGFVSRSAPQLNLFAIGMPVAMIAGIFFLAVALPDMVVAMIDTMGQALDHARALASGGPHV